MNVTDTDTVCAPGDRPPSHRPTSDVIVAVSARFDSPARLLYVNALFIIGTLGTLITPALLEAWATHGWGSSRLGVVAGIELAGLSVGSLSGLWWQRHWRWRRVAILALVLGFSGNALCILLDNYPGVCAARLMAGIAGGLLCALYSAVLANAAAPARVIAITTFVQIGVEAAFIYSSASLLRVGSSSLFTCMAVLFLALLPFIKHLPPGWPSAETPSAEAVGEEKRSLRAYPLLAAFVPFIIVQTGVYTFLGDFARLAAHLNEAQALHVIGISVLFSSLGSIAALLLSNRIGLRVPISAAILLMAVALCGTILGSSSELLFLVYISLLQIGWIFLNCYLYSAVIDANNLLVPATTPVSTLGSVLGASCMGYVLEHGGVSGALMLCLGSILATALLTLPFLTGRSARGLT